MTARRVRLDLELVRRGIFASRRQAQEAVEGGRVLVGGAVAERPSRLVAPGEPVEAIGVPRRFVSRGGEKLDAALDAFGLNVSGVVALDAGASTGGFTDCLLRRGAAVVIAVDVGHGQLDSRLRDDERVVVFERTHVRDLTLDRVARSVPARPGPVDLVTADLSFISLAAVVPALAGPIVRDGAGLILLVKPQFEAGRKEASRGRGVIRDPALWLAALRAVGSSLEACGAVIMGAVRSPLTGASGNVEFFVHAVAHPAPGSAPPAAPDSTDQFFRDAVAASAD